MICKNFIFPINYLLGLFLRDFFFFWIFEFFKAVYDVFFMLYDLYYGQ